MKTNIYVDAFNLYQSDCECAVARRNLGIRLPAETGSVAAGYSFTRSNMERVISRYASATCRTWYAGILGSATSTRFR